MKQTAVEWLAEHLCNAPIVDYWGAVEKAKEMEKEQIIEAFKQGVAYWNGDEWKLIDIREYYNRTFK